MVFGRISIAAVLFKGGQFLYMFLLSAAICSWSASCPVTFCPAFSVLFLFIFVYRVTKGKTKENYVVLT